MIEPHCDHFQCRSMSYRHATAREIFDRFGESHMRWIFSHDRPDLVCEGRARGEWDANNLEAMSAYERLAVLIGECRFTVEGTPIEEGFFTDSWDAQ